MTYNIAPNRNGKHSIILPSEDNGGETQAEHLDQPQEITTFKERTSHPSVEAFVQEKTWQRELSSAARFDNARKRLVENRARFHNACQKARKTKERATRDAAVAAACLVGDVPLSSAYVLVDSSEAPTVFIDLASRVAARPTAASLKKKPASGQQLLKTNWKGENMDLEAGFAYVLVTSHE